MSSLTSKPLAERMRPKSLSDYVGQKHLVGDNGIIRKSIENKLIPSIILWGPPGVGKTTLAELIAKALDRKLHTLSAINAGVKEVRKVIETAESNNLFNTTPPILFIDEIHRFSKSQQDSLLGAVERGSVTLIGATTENPSFEVIPALLSRCQTYVLESHTKEELEFLLQNAIDKDVILKEKKINLKETDALLAYSSGDARKLLNNFELVIQNSSSLIIDNQIVKSVLSKNPISYDKGGEQHYDVISAFIKSIRGSDPNAAVYWLARMVEGGEDPKFIARRLIISASEDIGNANPVALQIATDCFKAVEIIGYPECEIILSQATTYLASSPKSNASYKAIKEARQLVKNDPTYPVPLHLRNAPTQLMKNLDYGTGYKYSHDYPGSFIQQEFLPQEISGTSFYQPGNSKFENNLKSYLKHCWKDKYEF